MFDISAGEAVSFGTVVTALLVAYLGTQKGGAVKAQEIANAQPVNQTGMALLIDGRVLDRLTIACDRVATAIEAHLDLTKRRDAEERDEVLKLILEELKRTRQ